MNVSLPSTTKCQNILAFFTWNYLDPFRDTIYLVILPSSYNKFPCEKYITTWLYSCTSRLKPFNDS